MKRNSQSGVALVITLILLSVITFMAVTFLVVSRHEGAQVDTLAQQSNAKFAADAASEQAKALIVAQMLANNNGYNFGLVVSTNFIGQYFDISGNISGLTNVGYVLNGGSRSFAALDYEHMLNNLLILPRPPVFITTNKSLPNNLDFRYWLDLNRNGVYDTNGAVVEQDPNGLPGHTIVNNYVGDPEWVGILNRPDFRHSASNFFVARYCFIALPIGNSLDINYIHNEAKYAQLRSANQIDGFLRNQGVGSWEINLAGFLNSLNTNINAWGNFYAYNPTNSSGAILQSPSTGNAFSDAASILQYRYNNNNALNLRSFNTLYGNNAAIAFRNDFVDGYVAGPLMVGTSPLTNDVDPTGNWWSGDESPNQFFSTQDLFNSNPILNTFTNRLLNIGTNFNRIAVPTAADSYNRYTFYRMLSQMSFDSAAESTTFPYPNRMNLNYNNLRTNNPVTLNPITPSVTNFIPWTASEFFTNCANLLLTNAGYQFTITNIPIYPTNFYTPALHRLLQLAANIYDASTNRTFVDDPTGSTGLYYPSVFRPTFKVTQANGTNIAFINGYIEEVANTTSYKSIPLSLPEDINQLMANQGGSSNSTVNIYSIPWVIGARRGFPNFNEFSMETVSQIQRKVQVILNSQTNVQYTIGISNLLGFEAWNSYTTNYPRNVTFFGSDALSMYLYKTNDNAGTVVPLARMDLSTNLLIWGQNPSSFPPLISANWRGTGTTPTNPQKAPNVGSFITNFPGGMFGFPVTNFSGIILVPDLVYHATPAPPHLTPAVGSGTNFDVTTSPQDIQPHFLLSVTNRMQFAMVDQSGRVIDYVSFNHGQMDCNRDLTAELSGPNDPGNPTSQAGGNGGVWLTDFVNGTLQGVINQLQISQGYEDAVGFDHSGWIKDSLDSSSQSNAAYNFGQFMAGSLPASITSLQAPYSPTRKFQQTVTYQANDPLVHYTAGDLTVFPTNGVQPANLFSNISLANLSGGIGKVNIRYFPWSLSPSPQNPDVNADNIAVKDPLITRSDEWQFPTNKFPNIGWLGRVHRGTPWQTIYLKALPVDHITWQNWSGNNLTNFFGNTPGNLIYGQNIPDALLSEPTNDWNILNLFTTAPNDNASHGQLSVNQTNLAAWAAVLDGVITLGNTPSNVFPHSIDPSDTCIDPVTGNKTNLVQFLVNSINSVRSSKNPDGSFVYPGGVFTNVGQILAVPQLTTGQILLTNVTPPIVTNIVAPFLDTNFTTFLNPQKASAVLSDANYERIPQQIMSLLRVGTPRYVIFAYGQSLKPADHSIVTSGPFLGMCTNYQITGEVVTRTVLRIDNPPMPTAPLPAGSPPPPPQPSPHVVVESFNVMGPE